LFLSANIAFELVHRLSFLIFYWQLALPVFYIKAKCEYEQTEGKMARRAQTEGKKVRRAQTEGKKVRRAQTEGKKARRALSINLFRLAKIAFC